MASPVPDTPVHVLPARWSPVAQDALHGFLQANTDRSVQISAAALRRADCLMLQYLIAAARAWAAQGRSLAVTGVPPQLDEAFGLLGVTPDMLCGTA
jgi:anti-anti-sigma regulatory factor